MTRRELDRLLRGQAGVVFTLSNGQAIRLGRRELANPQAWRAAMRRQLGAGYRPPVYDEARHDEIIRVAFRLIDATERGRRAA